MICPVCNKNFEQKISHQIYCSRKCCKAAYYNRKNFRSEAPAPNALRYFVCEECGCGVNVFSRADQRYKFCSGQCYSRNKARRKYERRKRFRGGNLGMSGGMSLRSLIRRERRDLE